MWKKIIIMSIIVTMSLLLTACGEKGVRKLYDTAMNNMAKLEDIDVDVSLKMDSDNESVREDISAIMKIKAQDINSNQMKLSMPMEFTGGDNKSKTQIYYDGNYYYVELMGLKIKYKREKNITAKDSIGSSFKVAIPSEIISTIDMKRKDGNKVINFEAKGNKLNGIIKNLINQISFLKDKDTVKVAVKQVKGEIIVNSDSNVIEQTLNINFDMESDQERSKVTLKYNMKFNHPGEPVEVELPDLSTFVEINDTQLNSN